MNVNTIENMVDILMAHQDECGALEKDGDGPGVRCTKCGAVIVKKGQRAIIETKEFTIGLL